MTELTNHIEKELLKAMDDYKTIAQLLIDKLITETDQPEKAEIQVGRYFEIQNADLFNGQENLSDNWWFDVHGEHCLFRNLITGQTLEVSLGNKESIANLDPYFFYNFLETTENFRHLTKYFKNPFNDTLNLFKKLEKKQKMVNIYGVNFRKL
ncbi:DUF6896 domain-containing protein [Epilithonimonas arachidiradicis]|uniref:DUF6896 domain-containing protein n=1 Tax=Epilithonimonas arachidiradicis TaxID=1617282 RepID=A0A420DC43_9FLAO|nr:hypothetical protein [Epilithonimonas arachidiradicis]RKE88817.1 hypothetical protein BXY58_0944 [Epilithonimonas arachidiradicis]GGG54816.1 hypothetical protein GCM10007332_15580 [Epilithonimonas arachidiradicis]